MSDTRYFLIRIEKIKFSSNLQKNDKQSVKNNRPVSFLPIFVLAKSSDVLLQYDVHIFPENNLTCENQSEVKTNDSFVDQLLSITHEIFSCFDDNYEIRGVFLDISKVSDEVRHEEIIPKLKHNGISGNLLSTLTDFLRNRNERVILNCQSSF